jgi:hypothetical protein
MSATEQPELIGTRGNGVTTCRRAIRRIRSFAMAGHESEEENGPQGEATPNVYATTHYLHGVQLRRRSHHTPRSATPSRPA